MSSETRSNTQNAIDALVASVPCCDVALLTDSDTGLILCTSAGNALPQDALERLSDGAQDDLRLPCVDAVAALADGEAVSVSRIDADGWVVATRSAASPDDILVCRCDAAPDRAALDAAAATVFDVLTTAEGA